MAVLIDACAHRATSREECLSVGNWWTVALVCCDCGVQIGAPTYRRVVEF